MAAMAGKVAIITGASSGIGRAIAEAFAAEGARLVLVARGPDRLSSLAATLQGEGTSVLAVPADVSDESAVLNVFNRTREAFGRIDILVNNAGTASRVKTEDLTLDAWRSVIEVNLTAAFLCSREAFRAMKAQGEGGRILNIGSVSARVPRVNSVPYTASKFGLEGLTRAFALDGRPYRISVGIIHPGNTESAIWAGNEAQGRKEGLMPAAEVARVALVAATLPPEVSLLETVILPFSMPFLGRG
ncbi:MAG: SDR family oxidoreductase [Acetobacteraceae bacterium]